ncbi:MAG: DegV family protein [Chloroflexi bacterium]|nr:DegV family protein [Chloroflexota bacterium]
MSRVHIITDSAAKIDPNVAKRLDITVVPLKIRIEGKTYQHGDDIDSEKLLLRMSQEHIRPRIVGPTAEELRRIYAQVTRHTDQVISLHSSANLSLVHREARKAAGEFLGRCDIAVVDSETLSLGLGILAEEAARLAAADVSLSEIVRRIRGMIRHIYIDLITETLDYLEHSRLISPAQAILGTMLNIKPFLALEEGQIIPMEKVRSPERAIDKLAEFAGEFTKIDRIAILQSTPYPTDDTSALRERLESVAPGHEFPILLYGPVLACHIGPNALGLIVYEKATREVYI